MECVYTVNEYWQNGLAASYLERSNGTPLLGESRKAYVQLATKEPDRYYYEICAKTGEVLHAKTCESNAVLNVVSEIDLIACKLGADKVYISVNNAPSVDIDQYIEKLGGKAWVG